jgi:choline dehydrogenase
MDAETVVVGAGSAGVVIAARATERGDREVLLVEAGPDYPEGPAPWDLRDGRRNSMTAHDWGLRHRPTPGQVLFALPRGKVVGGSSAVNTCIALRGQPYDYDEWAARGLPAWRWEACLPAFKRLERDLDKRDEWHGQDGPVPIRRHPREELVPWQAAFIDACAELGFPACPDHNAPSPTGHGSHPMNKIAGERMSAARCYLTDEVRRRPNLRLRARTLVRRVLSQSRRVTGVEVETDGRVEVVRTSRVILSAGAIATPGILLRSGIGPRAQVERLGVELVTDLPAVGARLLDHPGAAIFLVPRAYPANFEHPLIQTMMRYTSEDSPYPNDMQLQPGSFLRILGVSLPLVSLMCCVGKPRGYGTIEHTSADPHARPKIDSRLLLDPADRARAVEALELAYRLTRTRAMSPLIRYLWPGERVLRSREEMSAWIPRSCDSGYHPCGTVPMGADDDRDAAVDQQGRVRGVTGLWVADASIMPTVPSVNTNLPTLMIGERFGEWLREGSL